MPDAPQTTGANCPGCTRVGRRAFVAQSTLVALGALLAACGSSTGPNSGLPLTVSLSDFPALTPVGGMARVDSGSGVPVAVVHAADASYLAYSLVCPHQGFLVNINGSGFLCSGHGARFASDGHWVGGQPAGNLAGLPVQHDAVAGTLVIG